MYITGQTDANGVAQAQAGVAPTDRDASVEADGYETTHLSLSVPDDTGITVDRSIAEGFSKIRRQVPDTITGEQIRR